MHASLWINAGYQIALHEPVEDIESTSHSAEHRVMTIEMRLW